jgi:hypothetical protein
LYDANLHTVFSAMALQALDIYRVGTPWLHQDTTTISFYGAYDDDEGSSQGPRPTYGYSKDGRGDLKQVILSLGVSGDGGIPVWSKYSKLLLWNDLCSRVRCMQGQTLARIWEPCSLVSLQRSRELSCITHDHWGSEQRDVRLERLRLNWCRRR